MPRVLPIIQLGQPILRKRLKPIARPASRATRRLAADMITTMKKAQGVGIAANQVGVDQRIFIVAPEPSERYPHAPQMPPLAMINPKLLKASKRLVTDWEGCLSIPGIRGRVPRHQALEIEFVTLTGETLRAKLSGFVARIFQHELDHINGFCFLDRVENVRTLMTENEYRKMMRK